jgi:hypothetical protein
LHPSSRPKPDLKTTASRHAGHDDIEKPALPNQMARGVEVRTK